MVQIAGKYLHQSSEGLEELLLAAGTPAEHAKAGANIRANFEIKEAGDSWTSITNTNGKESSTTFKLGEAYDEVSASGVVLKNVAVREGNTFIITSEQPDGNQSIRSIEFQDAGAVVNMTDKKTGKKAKLTYKRA